MVGVGWNACWVGRYRGRVTIACVTFAWLGVVAPGELGCFGGDSGRPDAGGAAFDGPEVGLDAAQGGDAHDAGDAAFGGPEAGLDAADAGVVASAVGTCPPDGGLTAGTPPTTIDFDTWPDDGGVIAAGTLISTQYPGVTFSSDACGGATVWSDGEASSPPNFLAGNPGSMNSIVMDLAVPVANVGATLISVGSSTVTATAYDASSRVIATISVTHPGTGVGNSAHDPIALTGAGIVRVVFADTTAYPGDGFGVDDISF
jgi:hypothetical protein